MSRDEDQLNEMEAMEAIYGSDYQRQSLLPYPPRSVHRLDALHCPI